jgi:hypothetical protein
MIQILLSHTQCSVKQKLSSHTANSDSNNNEVKLTKQQKKLQLLQQGQTPNFPTSFQIWAEGKHMLGYVCAGGQALYTLLKYKQNNTNLLYSDLAFKFYHA